MSTKSKAIVTIVAVGILTLLWLLLGWVGVGIVVAGMLLAAAGVIR
jgi:hypothetical protein